MSCSPETFSAERCPPPNYSVGAAGRRLTSPFVPRRLRCVNDSSLCSLRARRRILKLPVTFTRRCGVQRGGRRRRRSGCPSSICTEIYSASVHGRCVSGFGASLVQNSTSPPCVTLRCPAISCASTALYVDRCTAWTCECECAAYVCKVLLYMPPPPISLSHYTSGS